MLAAVFTIDIRRMKDERKEKEDRANTDACNRNNNDIHVW